MIQLLCGTVNLWNEDESGVKTLRPHTLQVSEGVCACADPEVWAARTAGMPPYYGGVLGDADWPAHTWWTAMPEKAVPVGQPDAKAQRAEKAPGPCTNPVCPACDVKVSTAAEWDGIHPEPAVTASDPIPEGVEAPAVVRGLQARAEGLGWSTNVTYARGNGVHGSTGRPTKLVDSWAVRCWRGRRRAVAVYSGGSWGDMWGIAHMFHARTLAQFETYLAGVDDAWVRAMRAENAMFEAHEACTGGDVHGEHPWWKKGGEGRYCSGRDTAKVKKTKEAGG